MTPHITPTEVELDWLRNHAASHDIPCLIRACDEICRLRALCGRAEPFVRASQKLVPLSWIADDYSLLADELRAASKGEL